MKEIFMILFLLCICIRDVSAIVFTFTIRDDYTATCYSVKKVVNRQRSELIRS